MNLTKDYHELLELMVCDRNSKECMIYRCESYPGVIAVKKFIKEELMKAIGDGQVVEYDVEITFQQWTTSYKAELISYTLPLEFIEQFWEQLDEVTSHFFYFKITISVSKQTKRELEIY